MLHGIKMSNTEGKGDGATIQIDKAGPKSRINSKSERRPRD